MYMIYDEPGCGMCYTTGREFNNLKGRCKVYMKLQGNNNNPNNNNIDTRVHLGICKRANEENGMVQHNQMGCTKGTYNDYMLNCTEAEV